MLHRLDVQHRKYLVYHRCSVHGQCLRSGCLGNKLWDGELHAVVYLGSAPGVSICVLWGTQDGTERSRTVMPLWHEVSDDLTGSWADSWESVHLQPGAALRKGHDRGQGVLVQGKAWGWTLHYASQLLILRQLGDGGLCTAGESEQCFTVLL
jgi:hypothetical protein